MNLNSLKKRLNKSRRQRDKYKSRHKASTNKTERRSLLIKRAKEQRRIDKLKLQIRNGGAPSMTTQELVDQILKGMPQLPELTVDPRIGTLEDSLKASNQQISNMQQSYNNRNAEYRKNIERLRGEIGGFEDQIGGYQSEIQNMSQQLIDQATKAKQFKLMDTQYLAPNNASGIRLRRSRKRKSGAFALGASGLNRKNRSPLQISSVNL